MPEYVPVASANAGPVPTLNRLLETAHSFGIDRLALVKRAEEDKPSQLLILLTSKASMRAIGPGLQKLMREFSNPDGSEKFLLHFDGDSPLDMLQDWMRLHAQAWRWFNVGQVTAVALCGNEVCQKAAVLLNANECPCNL